MKNYFLFTILFLIVVFFVSCTDKQYQLTAKQEYESDSLNNLASQIRFTHPDYALKLANYALDISIYPDAERAAIFNNIGLIHEIKGDYPEALDALMRADTIYDALKDEKGLSILYSNFAKLYSDEKNYLQSISYLLKAKTTDSVSFYCNRSPNIDDSIFDGKNLITDYINMSDLYDKLGHEHGDSNNYLIAESYAVVGRNLACSLQLTIKDKDFAKKNSRLIGILANNLGNINFDIAEKLNTNERYGTALRNYQESLINISIDKDTYCETMLGIAKCLDKLNRLDSVIWYSKASFDLADSFHNKFRKLEASKFLAKQYFKQRNALDSTCYFQKIALELSDSLYDINVAKFVNLSLKQDARERFEIQKKEEENIRTHDFENFLLFLLAFFSLIFFVRILSKTKLDRLMLKIEKSKFKNKMLLKYAIKILKFNYLGAVIITIIYHFSIIFGTHWVVSYVKNDYVIILLELLWGTMLIYGHGKFHHYLVNRK